MYVRGAHVQAPAASLSEITLSHSHPRTRPAFYFTVLRKGRRDVDAKRGKKKGNG